MDDSSFFMQEVICIVYFYDIYDLILMNEYYKYRLYFELDSNGLSIWESLEFIILNSACRGLFVRLNRTARELNIKVSNIWIIFQNWSTWCLNLLIYNGIKADLFKPDMLFNLFGTICSQPFIRVFM